jgi:hypothetical protein
MNTSENSINKNGCSVCRTGEETISNPSKNGRIKNSQSGREIPPATFSMSFSDEKVAKNLY